VSERQREREREREKDFEKESLKGLRISNTRAKI
jgi:hypothetical protein